MPLPSMKSLGYSLLFASVLCMTSRHASAQYRGGISRGGAGVYLNGGYAHRDAHGHGYYGPRNPIYASPFYANPFLANPFYARQFYQGPGLSLSIGGLGGFGGLSLAYGSLDPLSGFRIGQSATNESVTPNSSRGPWNYSPPKRYGDRQNSAYSYTQPGYQSNYSTQRNSDAVSTATGADLRPGMLLPDGSTIISVGPIGSTAQAQESTVPAPNPAGISM